MTIWLAIIPLLFHSRTEKNTQDVREKKLNNHDINLDKNFLRAVQTLPTLSPYPHKHIFFAAPAVASHSL